jgi:hypothetical protein
MTMNIGTSEPEQRLVILEDALSFDESLVPSFLGGSKVYPGIQTTNLKEQNMDSGFQVIFKLANIQLTPEKPSYNGGSWHVEGMSVITSLEFIRPFDQT